MWSNGFDSAIEHRRLCKHGYVPVMRVRLEGTEDTCGRGGRETRSAARSHHPRADGRVPPPPPLQPLHHRQQHHWHRSLLSSQLQSRKTSVTCKVIKLMSNNVFIVTCELTKPFGCAESVVSSSTILIQYFSYWDFMGYDKTRCGWKTHLEYYLTYSCFLSRPQHQEQSIGVDITQSFFITSR